MRGNRGRDGCRTRPRSFGLLRSRVCGGPPAAGASRRNPRTGCAEAGLEGLQRPTPLAIAGDRDLRTEPCCGKRQRHGASGHGCSADPMSRPEPRRHGCATFVEAAVVVILLILSSKTIAASERCGRSEPHLRRLRHLGTCRRGTSRPFGVALSTRTGRSASPRSSIPGAPPLIVEETWGGFRVSEALRRSPAQHLPGADVRR